MPSAGESVALIGGIVGILGGVGAFVVIVWKGGAQSSIWNERIASFERLVGRIEDTLEQRLTAIADEVHSLGLKVETLADTRAKVEVLWEERTRKAP